MQRAALTAHDLHALGIDEELDEVTAAVDDGLTVAVISEPFAGRTAVLEHVEAELDRVERQSAAGFDEGSDADVRLFEDCHRLYSRQIDGFERLDAFLDRIATADGVCVTSWNEYAWRYLDKTKEVTESFEVVVELPTVGVEQLLSWLGETIDSEVEYVDDTEELPTGFDTSEITSVSALREQLGLLRSGGDNEPQQAVFQAIRRISGGNPGVAKRLWADVADTAERDGVVRTSALVEFDVDRPHLDYDEAFALQVIVSNERLPKSELEGVVGSTLDRPLRRFEDQGLVTLDGEHVEIVPEALKNLVGHLENRRMVW